MSRRALLKWTWQRRGCRIAWRISRNDGRPMRSGKGIRFSRMGFLWIFFWCGCSSFTCNLSIIIMAWWKFRECWRAAVWFRQNRILQTLGHCHDLPMLSALACFASLGWPWAVAAFLAQRLSIDFSGLTSTRRRPPFSNFGVSMRVFSDASFDYASVLQKLSVKKAKIGVLLLLTLKEKPLFSRTK